MALFSNRTMRLVFPLGQVLGDALCVQCAVRAAFWVRFHSPFERLVEATKGIPPEVPYLWTSLGVTVVWLAVFAMHRMYGVRRDLRYMDELLLVLRGVTLAMLVLTSAAFFYRGFSYSRGVFVLMWLLGIVLAGACRLSLLKLQRMLHRRHRGVVRAVVVGSGAWAREVETRIRGSPDSGFGLVGRVGDEPTWGGGAERLGGFQDLRSVLGGHDVGALVVALSDTESANLATVIEVCAGSNVELYVVPTVLDLITSRPRMDSLLGVPVLKIRDAPLAGWGGIGKRAFDIGVSLGALAVLWPVLGLVWVAVRLSSGGGALYRQRRVGLDGHEFTIIKFRTMPQDAETDTGPVWTTSDDPRVTALGRFLRRWSLDELPQLVNVLKGEMSLVGPRPERPYFVRQFRESVPRYLERHRVRSGMTGWAQVNGCRGDVPIGRRTEYDVYYVENWSLWLDLRILLMTVWTVLAGKQSY